MDRATGPGRLKSPVAPADTSCVYKNSRVAHRYSSSAETAYGAYEYAPASVPVSLGGLSPADAATPGRATVKPALDRVLVLVSAPVVLPVVLLVVGAVKLTSRGPVFYSQHRLGQDGRAFRMWKFRSMCQDADRVLDLHLASNAAAREEWTRDQKLASDPRITRIGRFLRRSSLDELPQLWNVLNGTMSLVGPRPITEGEVHRYGSRFTSYTRVRPGMTGLWQVSGRSNTSYPRRVALDHQYVSEWSLPLDLTILARTVKCVLLREGAS